MQERTYFVPHIVDGKFTTEEIVSEGVPFSRFWTFSHDDMDWEEKRLACIAEDKDVIRLYPPHSENSADFIIYSDEAHKRSQLARFTNYNTEAKRAPYLYSEANCPTGAIEITQIHQDLVDYGEFEYVMDIEGGLALCMPLGTDEDDQMLENTVRHKVSQLIDALADVDFSTYPSRLGEINHELLAWSIMKAQARACARTGLKEEDAISIAMGLLAVDFTHATKGLPESAQGAQDLIDAYDLLAEGVLMVGFPRRNEIID